MSGLPGAGTPARPEAGRRTPRLGIAAGVKYRGRVDRDMPAPGDTAPDFEGVDASGRPFRLASLRGAPVILYFYPKANTPGCTTEAREFTQHHAEFARRGIHLVGVSVDSVEAQSAFAAKCAVPFPLIADADRSIARRYEVLGTFGLARRTTFLLDAELRVEKVVESMRVGPHIAAARAWADQPPRGPTTPGPAGVPPTGAGEP